MVPIEVIFLGTGSGVPTLKRGQPAVLISYSGDCMLFDCGEGCQTAMQKAKISPLKIKKIFISHWHADHFSGLLPLIETMHLFGRKEKLEVCGPEASRFIDSLLELSYLGFGFEIEAKDASAENREKVFSGADYEIFSIPVRHSIPAVGYLFREKDRWNIIPKKAKKLGLGWRALRQIKEKGMIKSGNKAVYLNEIAKITAGRKIIYSGDTEPCERLFEEKPDMIIHDSTFIEENDAKFYSHSSAQQVARLAKKHRIKKLVLTHLSRRYKTEKPLLDAIKPIFRGAVVARDGMKIVI